MSAPKYRKISSFFPKKANGVYKQIISTSFNDFTLSFKCDQTVSVSATYINMMMYVAVTKTDLFSYVHSLNGIVREYKVNELK